MIELVKAMPLEGRATVLSVPGAVWALRRTARPGAVVALVKRCRLRAGGSSFRGRGRMGLAENGEGPVRD